MAISFIFRCYFYSPVRYTHFPNQRNCCSSFQLSVLCFAVLFVLVPCFGSNDTYFSGLSILGCPLCFRYHLCNISLRFSLSLCNRSIRLSPSPMQCIFSVSSIVYFFFYIAYIIDHFDLLYRLCNRSLRFFLLSVY